MPGGSLGHGHAVEPPLPEGPEVGVQEGDVRRGGTFDGVAVAQDGAGVGQSAGQHFRLTVHGATTASSAQGPNARRRSSGSR